MILERLASSGAIQIVVEHELDADGSWRRYVEAAGAKRLDDGAGWSRFESCLGQCRRRSSRLASRFGSRTSMPM